MILAHQANSFLLSFIITDSSEFIRPSVCLWDISWTTASGFITTHVNAVTFSHLQVIKTLDSNQPAATKNPDIQVQALKNQLTEKDRKIHHLEVRTVTA